MCERQLFSRRHYKLFAALVRGMRSSPAGDSLADPVASALSGLFEDDGPRFDPVQFYCATGGTGLDTPATGRRSAPSVDETERIQTLYPAAQAVAMGAGRTAFVVPHVCAPHELWVKFFDERAGAFTCELDALAQLLRAQGYAVQAPAPVEG